MGYFSQGFYLTQKYGPDNSFSYTQDAQIMITKEPYVFKL